MQVANKRLAAAQQTRANLIELELGRRDPEARAALCELVE